MTSYLEKLESIYKAYQPAIYAYLLRQTKNTATAEDLCQDVFLKAFEALPHFRGDATMKSWLYRIAHNHYVSYFRKKDVQVVTVMEDTNLYPLLSAVHSPEDFYLQKEKLDELYRILDEMKPIFRDILILRDMQELSYQEIAHVLGWSLSKVKTTIHRARLQYKKEAGKKGVGSDEMLNY